MVANELDNAVHSFGRYMRNIKNLLSPVVDTAYKLQNEWGDINIRKVKTSTNGLWTTQVCVDASTKIKHTKNDCTYTVISVPKQVNALGKKQRKMFTSNFVQMTILNLFSP